MVLVVEGKPWVMVGWAVFWQVVVGGMAAGVMVAVGARMALGIVVGVVMVMAMAVEVGEGGFG